MKRTYLNETQALDMLSGVSYYRLLGMAMTMQECTKGHSPNISSKGEIIHWIVSNFHWDEMKQKWEVNHLKQVA